MNNLFNRQITLHIILSSITICTNMLATQPDNPINSKSAAFHLDDKTYIISAADINDLKNKEASIKQSNFWPHMALLALIPGWGFVVGDFIGKIFGLNSDQTGPAVSLIGSAASVYIEKNILPAHDNKPLHELLKQKQAEYKKSLN